jgi:hypothetical protein
MALISLVRNIGFVISRLVGISFLCLTTAACAQHPSPIPEEVDNAWFGNITSGESHGVEIGDEFIAARDILIRDGFSAGEMISCSRSLGIVLVCSASHEFVKFRMKQFGKSGSIYLVIEDGKVVQIVWSFSILQFP